MKIIWVLSLLLFQASVLAAPMETFKFETEAKEKIFHKLSDELRCLVCQNQSIADSNADLAKDLRAEIFVMLKAGKTEQQIKAFMVDRYGDYVLYQPPMKPMTWLLWFGPLMIFLLGLFYVRGFIVKQMASDKVDELSAEEIERVAKLQSSLSKQKNKADDKP